METAGLDPNSAEVLRRLEAIKARPEEDPNHKMTLFFDVIQKSSQPSHQILVQPPEVLEVKESESESDTRSSNAAAVDSDDEGECNAD